VKGIELMSPLPFSGFFVQPVDGCPILVAVGQCDQFRWSTRMFLKVRDVVRFPVVFVFPVGEQRVALVSGNDEL